MDGNDRNTQNSHIIDKFNNAKSTINPPMPRMQLQFSMAIWILLLFLALFDHKSFADTDGASLAATAPVPDTNIMLITLGAFVLAMTVVVAVYLFARKRALVEGPNQASALDHAVVKEGGGGYWPPPPRPSAPPMEASEELERGGAAPVKKEVCGEIVELKIMK